MNIYTIILAMIITAVIAYFVGTKTDKNAFQFLTEDNGNFSLIRLVVLLSNIAFLFALVFIVILTKRLPEPTWQMVVYMIFVNLLKVLQKWIEKNPEDLAEILKILRK